MGDTELTDKSCVESSKKRQRRFTNMEEGKLDESPEFPSAIVTLSEDDIAKIASAVKKIVLVDIGDIVSKAVNKCIESNLSDVLSVYQVEVDKLKLANQSLVSENKELKKANKELHTSMDALEQYSRRNSIRIAGIQESPGEKTDEIVLEIAKRAKVLVSDKDIDRSHRVGPPVSGGHRPILVKFTTHRPKYQLMKARKDWKKPNSHDKMLRSIYVNEDLTKTRSKLFSVARLYMKQKLCSRAWSWDGKVFITDLSDSKHRIDSLDDLVKFGPIPSHQTLPKFTSAGHLRLNK